MLYLARMAKIPKFVLANSLLDQPMATWLTLMGTLDYDMSYPTVINSPVIDSIKALSPFSQ